MPVIQNLKTERDLINALYEMQVYNKKIETFHLRCKKKPNDVCVKTAYSTIDVILKSLTYASTEFEAPDIEHKYGEPNDMRFHRAKSVIDSGYSRSQKLPRYEVSSPKLHKSDRFHTNHHKSSQSSITDTCSQQSSKSIRSKSREFVNRPDFENINKSNITSGHERSKSRTREASKPKIREKSTSRTREKSRMRENSYISSRSRSKSRYRSKSRSTDQNSSPSFERYIRRDKRSESRISRSRERSLSNRAYERRSGSRRSKSRVREASKPKIREKSTSRARENSRMRISSYLGSRSRSKSKHRSKSRSIDETYSSSSKRSMSRSKRSKSRISRSRERSIPKFRNHAESMYFDKPNQPVDLDGSLHLHLSESDEENVPEKLGASTSTWDTQVTNFVSKIRRSAPHDQSFGSRMSQPELQQSRLKETGIEEDVTKDKMSEFFEISRKRPIRDPRIQRRNIQIVLNKLNDKKI